MRVLRELGRMLAPSRLGTVFLGAHRTIRNQRRLLGTVKHVSNDESILYESTRSRPCNVGAVSWHGFRVPCRASYEDYCGGSARQMGPV